MNEEKQTCVCIGENVEGQKENHYSGREQGQGGEDGRGKKKEVAQRSAIMSASITDKQKRAFWKKVHVVHGSCWMWKGAIHRSGYGMIRINGITTAPHRVSWLIHNGDIPDGLFCCHRCDVRACVNPAHIFLGTAGDNMVDKANKGRCNAARGDRNGSKTRPDRLARGEHNPQAKLSENKVREIRARHSQGGISGRALAKEFGVCPDVISQIIRRKLWAHVP